MCMYYILWQKIYLLVLYISNYCIMLCIYIYYCIFISYYYYYYYISLYLCLSTYQKYVNQIHALESKLQSVQSSVHKADPHLREKCRKLEAQVVQLEGHCRQLDEEVRVLKASRALLLHRLRNQEERAELEYKDRDRGFHEKHIGAQVHGVDSRIRRLLAEAQQDIKNKEDLIEGLNAALVELRRSRASEVMRLEAELVRLRRQAASREANLDGLDSGNGQELISTIHKQEKGEALISNLIF